MAIRYRHIISTLLLATAVSLVAAPAEAQYFGRNKVQYDKFDFKVLATEHFDIYFYPVEAAAAAEAGRMAERWYGRLSRLLGHTLTSRQIVVLYASHPDFEQTNVVEGELDEGTGGVTEGALRRIVMPLAATLADSDHVLGHELVHAFQYDMLGANIQTLPLWFVEGMAEYLSIGPRSAQTAMWLRDAAIEDRLPAIDKLDDPRYFPYRFGHGFWAYVGGQKGDRIIGEILRNLSLIDRSSTSGIDAVALFESLFAQKRDEISTAWHNAIRETYGVAAAKTPKTPPADYVALGFRTGGGSLNIGPSLSPDGKKLAFLSARDLLSIDLYLADADTGKILKQLVRTAGDPHFESLQFLASAGTWAPDNRRLAIAAVRQGRPALAILDTDTGRILEEIRLPDYGEIFQPSWSPDGKSIAFSAQTGGTTDLHVYDLSTRQARRLTTDAFADLHPAWSPDGTQIAFVTERFRGTLATLDFKGLSLALINVATGNVEPVNTGLAAGLEIDPKWSADGRTLFFIADDGGKPDLYRVDLGSARAAQITDFSTGVSGITPTSPALSIATGGSRAAFSTFVNGGFEIQFTHPSRLTAMPTEPRVRDQAVLPPPRKESVVAAELGAAERGLPPSAATFTEEKAKAGFGLVGVGSQVGAATSGTFGTYATGGIALQFSDVLGNHSLGLSVDVNGRVKDIGASALYINRTSRWNWGVFGQHLPLTSGQVSAGLEVLGGRVVNTEQAYIQRQTYTQGGALIAFPFSRTSRVEFSSSMTRIGFGGEIRSSYFDPSSGAFLGEDVVDLPSEPAIRMYDVKAAFIRDTSTMGAVSPVVGQRFRAEIAPTGGDLRMNSVMVDFRQYLMPFRPVTFAVRALHIARYGSGGEDTRLQPLFLGYSTFVRGYDPNSFSASECTFTAVGSCEEFDRLSGSRLVVFNGETRIPAFGLVNRKIDYGPIPLEIFGFLDAGVAWTRNLNPSFAGGSRDWVTSAGIGARVNALGFAIVELNMARPLQRPGAGWQFVFNLRPGF